MTTCPCSAGPRSTADSAPAAPARRRSKNAERVRKDVSVFDATATNPGVMPIVTTAAVMMRGKSSSPATPNATAVPATMKLNSPIWIIWNPVRAAVSGR